MIPKYAYICVFYCVLLLLWKFTYLIDIFSENVHKHEIVRANTDARDIINGLEDIYGRNEVEESLVDLDNMIEYRNSYGKYTIYNSESSDLAERIKEIEDKENALTELDIRVRPEYRAYADADNEGIIDDYIKGIIESLELMDDRESEIG